MEVLFLDSRSKTDGQEALVRLETIGLEMESRERDKQAECGEL